MRSPADGVGGMAIVQAEVNHIGMPDRHECMEMRDGSLFQLPDTWVAGSWFVYACGDIVIVDKPAAGLSPMVGRIAN